MPKYVTGHLSREWDELSGIHDSLLIYNAVLNHTCVLSQGRIHELYIEYRLKHSFEK